MNGGSYCGRLARRRLTSGTSMARLMAVVISGWVPVGKLRVRRPRWNSALGWAGSPATAARTLASTMACRKSGTGAVVGPREMRRDFPSRTTLARMGVVGRAGPVTGFAVGRGIGRGVGLGAAVSDGAVATPGGVVVMSVGRRLAQAGTRRTATQEAAMSFLRGMKRSLSCGR